MAHARDADNFDERNANSQILSGDEKLLNMGFAEDKLFAMELGALRHRGLEAAHTHKAGTG